MRGDGELVVSVADIIGFLEERFPLALAEEWDNVGLQLGAPCMACRTIMTCLTVTEAAVDYAVEMGVDLIIAHHPLIFTPLKSIIYKKLPGRIISKLLTHHISLYVAHTNADQALGGLNDWLALALDLSSIAVLQEDTPPTDGVAAGYGRIGELASPLSLRDFVIYARQALRTETVRYIGDEDQRIRKVAVSCGSGSHLWPVALKARADVLVTGDVKYHTAMEVLDTPLALVDGGHFGTEAIFASELAKILESRSVGRGWSIRVIAYDKEHDPWKGV